MARACRGSPPSAARQGQRGLLLFSNDPEWAARPTDRSGKTYHVQVDTTPMPPWRAARGVPAMENLRAAGDPARGEKNAAGNRAGRSRNRQIRRLLQACDIGVLRAGARGMAR
jgi:23S rRNA pseudouridine2605 synthase